MNQAATIEIALFEAEQSSYEFAASSPVVVALNIVPTGRSSLAFLGTHSARRLETGMPPIAPVNLAGYSESKRSR